MSTTALAWLVGLSGLTAYFIFDPRKLGTAAWIGIIFGTEMTGWWLGVHNGHWRAAIVCAAIIALAPTLGVDGPPGADLSGEAGLSGAIAGIALICMLITVQRLDVIPACSWMDAHHEMRGEDGSLYSDNFWCPGGHIRTWDPVTRRTIHADKTGGNR